MRDQNTIEIKDKMSKEEKEKFKNELYNTYMKMFDEVCIPKSLGSHFVIEMFIISLVKKGLKEDTISKHRDNIYFFFNSYLTDYCYFDESFDELHEKYDSMRLESANDIFEKVLIIEPAYRTTIDIRDITETTIEAFLTDFCLRKLWSYKKSDISSFLSTFKKFYKFLLKHKTIDIEAITKKFNQNVFLKSNFFQWDVPYFHVIYSILLKLEVIEINEKYHVEAGLNFEEFHNTKDLKKLLLMFLVLWDMINWRDLLKPSASGLPERSQSKRFILSESFSEAGVGFDYNYDEFLIEYISDYFMRKQKSSSFDGGGLYSSQTPQYEFYNVDFLDRVDFELGVVPDVILPVLESMGLIELTFQNPSTDDEKKNPTLNRGIDRFKMNEFGSLIWKNQIKHFSKEWE